MLISTSQPHVFEVGCGSDFIPTVRAAQQKLRVLREEHVYQVMVGNRNSDWVKCLFFSFNGVRVRVRETSDPELLHRDFQRASRGYLGESAFIGPHPVAVLPADVVAHEAGLAAEAAARQEQERIRYQEEQARQTVALEDRLALLPPLVLTDAEGWAESVAANQDDYGAATMRFAERWGRLLQAELAAGKPLAEAAPRYGAGSGCRRHQWFHV